MVVSMKKNSFKIIWFFLKQYKPQIAALSFLSLLVGGLEAMSVAAIYPILDTAFDKGSQSGNFILSMFKRLAELLPFKDLFVGYCFIFILVAFLTFVIKSIFL